MKKLLKFFCSMKFALILLIILALACTAGSVIPQGCSLSYYTEAYSTQAAGAIMLFGLDDIFHCWWFVILTVILCANLLGCNVLRFPALIRRSRTGFSPEERLKTWNGVPAAVTDAPEQLFQNTGFRRIVSAKDAEGRECLYAVKNKAGIWGAWLCHLGMLIVILGFGLGQMIKTEYTVYGVPGQTRAVGDTGYELTIDDFDIALREDGTVEQYTSALTMTNTATGESAQGETSVNSPLSLFGMKLYQNSTGWAATMKVWYDGEEIQESLLCAGEYAYIEGLNDVVIMLSAFYPDYVESSGTPMTASSRLNNPGYLYMIYYQDEVLGMNVLTGDDKITIEDYEIRFTDPQSYTLIQIKRDPFTKLTAVGGLIILIALILAFYLRTAEIWAVKQEDGRWFAAGYSKKGGEEFLERIRLYGEVPPEHIPPKEAEATSVQTPEMASSEATDLPQKQNRTGGKTNEQ